jgi:DNA-binding transcriptional LysR family regulator
MKEIDRRSVLTGLLCGAAIASVGVSILPKMAQSTPLMTAAKEGITKPEALVEEARVVVYVGPRRHHRHRHRRWRCRWHRGRQICGWHW